MTGTLFQAGQIGNAEESEYDGYKSYDRDVNLPKLTLWRGHPAQTMMPPKESRDERTAYHPTDRIKHMKEDEYDGLQL